jgi:hypothetical protein
MAPSKDGSVGVVVGAVVVAAARATRIRSARARERVPAAAIIDRSSASSARRR